MHQQLKVSPSQHDDRQSHVDDDHKPLHAPKTPTIIPYQKSQRDDQRRVDDGPLITPLVRQHHARQLYELRREYGLIKRKTNDQDHEREHEPTLADRPKKIMKEEMRKILTINEVNTAQTVQFDQVM